MSSFTTAAGVVPIIPCIDLGESAEFYGRLGFLVLGDHGDYLIVETHDGLRLHLRAAAEEGIDPLHNPNGIYVYASDVDALAREMSGRIIGQDAPRHTVWGTYEFAVSDPNGTLVRVGRPSAR